MFSFAVNAQLCTHALPLLLAFVRGFSLSVLLSSRLLAALHIRVRGRNLWNLFRCGNASRIFTKQFFVNPVVCQFGFALLFLCTNNPNLVTDITLVIIQPRGLAEWWVGGFPLAFARGLFCSWFGAVLPTKDDPCWPRLLHLYQYNSLL